jgi:hypothetical protein
LKKALLTRRKNIFVYLAYPFLLLIRLLFKLFTSKSQQKQEIDNNDKPEMIRSFVEKTSTP